MKFTPSKINLFTLFKLPSVYFSGVRLKSITEEESVVVVKHKWINQNPFRSLFWAVQGMAAELSTGVLLMREIYTANKKISMLVVDMDANFTKKAKGRVVFKCNEVALIQEKISSAVRTGEGQVFILSSKGVDELGDVVSTFNFKWSIKVK